LGVSTTDPPQTPTLRDRLEFWIANAAFRGLGLLPRKLALRLGAAIGDLLYLLDARDRRIALANLARAFPDKPQPELRAIVRRSSRNLGRLLAETSQFPKLTPNNISDFVSIENPELWKNEIERAKQTGGIILTAHLGNFELLAYAHGLWGHPVTLVHRTMRNPLVDQMILDIRERAGTISLPKKNAARLLIRSLRNKELVALPADQNQRTNTGVFADFFGIPACTTPGPARLAAHTGAPIVPVFLVREGESERHRLVIYPEIELADTGDKLADLIETTERCNRAIERILTDHPDQWIWFHKRWRTRPEGEPPLY
jgi:KDO2-lipid IV(A) lauroyltransferase